MLGGSSSYALKSRIFITQKSARRNLLRRGNPDGRIELNPGGIVERNPARAGLELAPARLGAFAGGYLRDLEGALPGKGTGAAVVRAGTTADVQIGDAHLHLKGTVGNGSGRCPASILVVVLLAIGGTLLLNGGSLVCGFLVALENGIGSRPDGLSRLEGFENRGIHRQFLAQEAELPGKVTHRYTALLHIGQQRRLAGVVRPLRQSVAVAIVDEVAVCPGVHRGGKLIIGHAERLVAVVLEVPRVQRRLGVQVAHQPSHAIGVSDKAHEGVPDGLLRVGDGSGWRDHGRRRGLSRRVIGGTAITEDAAVTERVAAPRHPIAGVALDGIYLRCRYLLHDAGVRGVVEGRAEEDLVAGLGSTGMEPPLVLVVAQGIGAPRPGALFRLAEQAQGVLIAVSRQEAPIHEHIAPGVAILFPVVPPRVLLVEVAGVLGVVCGPGVGGLVVELAVALFLLVSDLTHGDGKDPGDITGGQRRQGGIRLFERGFALLVINASGLQSLGGLEGSQPGEGVLAEVAVSPIGAAGESAGDQHGLHGSDGTPGAALFQNGTHGHSSFSARS